MYVLLRCAIEIRLLTIFMCIAGLITWTDPVSGEDFALSFHDGRCCKGMPYANCSWTARFLFGTTEVLENICYVQQAMLSHTEVDKL